MLPTLIWTGNYFNDALTLLDDTRDAEELAKLKKMLNKF